MLTDYRGVKKETLLESILTAAGFLQDQHLGSVAGDLLDEWVCKSPCDLILMNVEDNQSLAQTLHITGTSRFFALFRDVFEVHALTDLQDGGAKSPHYDLYSALQSWGGLDIVQTDDPTPLSREIDSHVALALLGRLNLNDIDPEKPEASGFREALASIKTKSAEIAGGLPAYARDVFTTLLDHGPDHAKERFLDGRKVERHFLILALLHAAGLPELRHKLPKGPIARYGIALADYKTMEEREPAHTYALKTAVRRALHKHVEQYPDDVMSITIGPITTDFTQGGISFDSTRRAAQLIAETFPGHEIIDRNGTRLPPSQMPAHYASTPRTPGL